MSFIDDQVELDFTIPPPGAKNRAEQVFEAFKAFHTANPEIWQLFQRFTFEVMRSGRPAYSSDAIVHRIRWHTDIESNGTDGVKINNNFTAYYARMFEVAYPDNTGFFRNRKLTTQDKDARDEGMGFTIREPENEEDMKARLQALIDMDV